MVDKNEPKAQIDVGNVWHDIDQDDTYGPDGKRKIRVKNAEFGTDDQGDVPEKDGIPKLDVDT